MKKIYLSKTDKKIFGVCGGIGQAYDIDPNLIRIVCIFLCVATALIPMLVTYFVAWAIILWEPKQ
ncbi:PspC domain-containing protein [Planctomycetota bacterium]